MEGEGEYDFVSENIEENVGSGDEVQDQAQRGSRYHRHTPHQIQELEAAYKDNPHPEEKERLALGRKLNLEPKQVKFWFQNRRTQMKAQFDRYENAMLKQEHTKLDIENISMKEAMKNIICTNCGAPAIPGVVNVNKQHLMVENARLREELNRTSILADKFFGHPVSSTTRSLLLRTAIPTEFGDPGLPPLGTTSVSAGSPMPNPTTLVDLALGAMEELMTLGQANEPIWVPNLNGAGELLDFDAYLMTSPRFLRVKPQAFVSEASRATGVVMITTFALVEALLDSSRWRDIFPCMIGSSTTVEVISGSALDTRNSSLQLMEAEIQLLSPLVPVRRVRFVRFCRQQAEGVWAIVDISVDAENPEAMSKRLPSGCIVYDLPNGYSKIVWIEHMEYDESLVYNQYRPLIRSSLGFGAQKWISALEMHYENLAALMLPAIEINGNSVISPDARRSLSKLAQEMMFNFCSGICATGDHKWHVISGHAADMARVMVRTNVTIPGNPLGGVMSATSVIWLPVQHQHLFNLLLNQEFRSHWDVLSDGNSIQTMVRLPKGRETTNPNNICLLRAKSLAPGPSASVNQNQTLILQECSTDLTGSLIVYAVIDTPSITVALSGVDPAEVPIVPSGISIVPDCADPNAPMAGSLVTVGLQVIVADLPASLLNMNSVTTVVNLLTRTVQGIRNVVQSNQQGGLVNIQPLA